jgi:hypothetical protein
VLPEILKAGISEAALFTRQRTRRTVTTQRTSATQLVGSFFVATELLGRVSSIQAAKRLLKGESAEKIEIQDREQLKTHREFQIIGRYRRLRESIRQRRVSRI